MRIAVDGMLLGGRHSGVEVAIEGLCRGLGAGAAGQRYLVAHRPNYDASDLATEQLQAYRAPWWTVGRTGRIVWEHTSLSRTARAWGAQVLHAPGYVLPMDWHGPSVVTIYDIIALTHPQWCKRANVLYYRAAVARGVRRASLAVTPSEFVKAELVRAMGMAPERVRVARLGIAPDMRPASSTEVSAARAALGLPEPYIVWVGNLEPKKNVEGMVRAFEVVAPTIPHHFVLVGRPGWRYHTALCAIESSPCRSRIHRVGYVPPAVLAALYTGADLHVHWSLTEGAGLTPLEAMACGTPSIVSDGGALPELAGTHARVVPLGDPSVLAQAMAEMLTGASGPVRCTPEQTAWAQGHTWNSYAAQLRLLYEEAAAIGA